MNKQKINKLIQSLITIPMLSIVIPFNVVTLTPTSIASTLNQTTDSTQVIITPEDEARNTKAEEIDSFFASYNSPLEGYGMKFVLEAEKNDIDYRLLPAIAMRESTGGKQACKKVSNSVFGYGSCKISFNSIDESIEIVSASLGGNGSDLSKHHYDGKTTLQILRKYNSVIKNYPNQVVKIMNMISNDSQDVA